MLRKVKTIFCISREVRKRSHKSINDYNATSPFNKVDTVRILSCGGSPYFLDTQLINPMKTSKGDNKESFGNQA